MDLSSIWQEHHVAILSTAFSGFGIVILGWIYRTFKSNKNTSGNESSANPSANVTNDNSHSNAQLSNSGDNMQIGIQGNNVTHQGDINFGKK